MFGFGFQNVMNTSFFVLKKKERFLNEETVIHFYDRFHNREFLLVFVQ